VDSKGIPRLCDFGLSWMLVESTLWQASTSKGSNGTTRWMAPELFEYLEGRTIKTTKKTDVWAYGMTCIVCDNVSATSGLIFDRRF
jgi:serine/threonine protein kinase